MKERKQQNVSTNNGMDRWFVRTQDSPRAPVVVGCAFGGGNREPFVYGFTAAEFHALTLTFRRFDEAKSSE